MKTIYIKPELEVIPVLIEKLMEENSFGTDGSHTSITEQGEDEDITIFGKDGSNMWDGWDD